MSLTVACGLLAFLVWAIYLLWFSSDQRRMRREYNAASPILRDAARPVEKRGGYVVGSLAEFEAMFPRGREYELEMIPVDPWEVLREIAEDDPRHQPSAGGGWESYRRLRQIARAAVGVEPPQPPPVT